MALIKTKSFACILKLPQMVALLNSTHTNETALYNLNETVYAIVMHTVEQGK